MGECESRTAIVFIHGIGVQDRYQQLTDFSDGLIQTLKEGARFENPEAEPALSNFVPLIARDEGGRRREVEVQEVFWGPLLNGKTKLLSVLGWTGGLVFRSLSLVGDRQAAPRLAAREGEAKRETTSPEKWLYTVAYLLVVLGLAALVFWTLLSATILSLDQTTYLKVKTEAATGRDPSAPQLVDLKPKDLGLVPGVDYGPGHVLIPKGTPRLPVPRDAAGKPILLKAPTVRREIDLMLTRNGDLKGQDLVENRRYRAPGLGRTETALRRLYSFWTFVRTSVGYLPSRDPSLPALAFGDLIGGQGLVRDVEASQIGWGAAFFVLAYATTVFMGRGLKNAWRAWTARRRLKRTEGVQAEGTLRRTPEQVGRLKKNARQAWAVNLAFGIAFLVATLSCGTFVSHVAAYLLGSVALLRLAYQGFNGAITEIVGDVQIYTTRDENSDKFEAREKVLCLAVDRLWEVLESERYDDVIVAGHSLGSVVGIEAIRRMASCLGTLPKTHQDRAAFGKLRAFVTFGSPLEKTRLYFQRDDFKSRYAEYSQQVDFRIFGRPKTANDPAPRPKAEREPVRWINYWMFDDLVCDPLATYPVERETRLGFRGRADVRAWPKLWPHSDYWNEPTFVRDLAELVLEKAPSETPGEGERPNSTSGGERLSRAS